MTMTVSGNITCPRDSHPHLCQYRKLGYIYFEFLFRLKLRQSVNLIEKRSVGALHDESGGQIGWADDEEVLLLVVADEIGHGARRQRQRHPERRAYEMLRRRRMNRESDGAVGKRGNHACPHHRVKEQSARADPLVLVDHFGRVDSSASPLGGAADDTPDVGVAQRRVADVEGLFGDHFVRLDGAQLNFGRGTRVVIFRDAGSGGGDEQRDEQR